MMLLIMLVINVGKMLPKFMERHQNNIVNWQKELINPAFGYAWAGLGY